MSKDFSAEGKYVFITAANSGIGKYCTMAMDRAGFNVLAGVHRHGEELEKEASDRLKLIRIDITDTESVAAAKKEIESIVGENGLYAVVNMAGLSGMGPVEFTPVEEVKKVFDVNVFGTYNVIQAMIPLVRKTKGRIVNVSSDAGLVAYPFAAPYCSSKSAVEAISDSLRVELRPWDIKVVLIEPGNVKTNMWQKAVDGVQKQMDKLPPEAIDLYRTEYEKWANMQTQGMPPQKIADTLMEILTTKNPKTRYVVGTDAKISELISHLPDKLRDAVVWKVIASYESENRGEK